ncbi:methylenetetrahydrofolate reductase (NAD(P)H) [delta proteobacterium NaphS2]|nr:methylenetetrahydrofolate reductase (NAD(P)H) [delta proteobacterium NaphS2]
MPLKEKIAAGKFIILGEFEPPKGADFDSFITDANLVKGRVEALVVPEMANAVLKASSLGGCACLEREGIPSVFQVCCRDRNRLALQADILSAAALGVQNIMAVNGVETRFGDHPQTRTVNDLDLIELIETVQTLSQGKDLAGVELKGTPGFSVGSTIDAGAAGNLLDIEMERLEKMLENGVDYVITNPVFDLRRFEQFVKRVDTSKIAVLPTVLLLKSAGMARYIDRNMRGITIPPDTIRRIQKAPDKVQECIRIAAETIKQVKKMGLAGVLISTVGWESKLPSVLNEAQL